MFPAQNFTFATLQWQFNYFAFVVYASAGDEFKVGCPIEIVSVVRIIASVVGRHSMFVGGIIVVVVGRLSKCCQFFRWDWRWRQTFIVVFVRRRRWLVSDHFCCFVAGGSNYNRNGTT
uniref:Uncharacterized protein n=1 Tax=Meloidogyne incognita TaxID=6306 RepID=A0A914L5M9_MELIC